MAASRAWANREAGAVNEVAVVERTDLPVGSIGYHAAGWWGMLGGILTEAALFAYLLFSYYYSAVQPHSGPWVAELPRLTLALPNTLVLLASSVAVWFGEYGTKRGNRLVQLLGLGTAIALGIVFVVIQYFEWQAKPFTLTSSPYGSLFFTITGFHMAHVIVGLIILISLMFWAAQDYFGPIRHSAVSIGAIYWHFVDAVWLAVFFTLYVTPYLT
jgi:cytochrome c oxidase subunit III